MRWAEHGGWGALQIVGKYNVLDLSDAAFNAAGGCRNTQLYPAVAASSSVTLVAPSVGLCGEMKTWTVGMNWYLNDYVRLMFDYSRIRPRRLSSARTLEERSRSGRCGGVRARRALLDRSRRPISRREAAERLREITADMSRGSAQAAGPADSCASEFSSAARPKPTPLSVSQARTSKSR